MLENLETIKVPVSVTKEKSERGLLSWRIFIAVRP